MQNQQDKSLSAQVVKSLKNAQNFIREKVSSADIISLIEEDHKPLKELIKIMKDSGRPLDERRQAFMEFAPLLMTHAKAEEKSLYDFIRTKAELREHAFEGDAEHSIADQMIEEIKRTTDQDQFSAKIKVVAELVEHHIKEEENEILPDVKKHLAGSILLELSDKYIAEQELIIAEGQDDSPHESEIVTENKLQ